MKCPSCGNEIVVLTKRLTVWDIILWIFLLFIPIIGWIIIFWEVGWYLSKQPDLCPICGRGLRYDIQAQKYQLK